MLRSVTVGIVIAKLIKPLLGLGKMAMLPEIPFGLKISIGQANLGKIASAAFNCQVLLVPSLNGCHELSPHFSHAVEAAAVLPLVVNIAAVSPVTVGKDTPIRKSPAMV